MKGNKKACDHASLVLPSLEESSAFCGVCVPVGTVRNENISYK
jgi:hypothetical protein